jgi:hypothetical protein
MADAFERYQESKVNVIKGIMEYSARRGDPGVDK